MIIYNGNTGVCTASDETGSLFFVSLASEDSLYGKRLWIFDTVLPQLPTMSLYAVELQFLFTAPVHKAGSMVSVSCTSTRLNPGPPHHVKMKCKITPFHINMEFIYSLSKVFPK